MSIYFALELDLRISLGEIQDKIVKMVVQLEADYKDQENVLAMVMICKQVVME
ncbi:MAG: hypothetical protein ACH349_04195 [Candidatus Rhabdochlamydia sp.]